MTKVNWVYLSDVIFLSIGFSCIFLFGWIMSQIDQDTDFIGGVRE